MCRALGLAPLEPHVYADSQAQALRSTLERMTAGGLVLLLDVPS